MQAVGPEKLTLCQVLFPFLVESHLALHDDSHCPLGQFHRRLYHPALFGGIPVPGMPSGCVLLFGFVPVNWPRGAADATEPAPPPP